MTNNDKIESLKTELKKRPTPARHWVLTEHNIKRFKTWSKLELAALKIRLLSYQIEDCPKTSKLHLQGYVEFFDPVRLASVKNRLGSNTLHAEKRKGTRRQAYDYSRKDDSPYFTSKYPEWSEHGGRHEGTEHVELGTFGTEQGARTDLQQMVDKIREATCEYDIWEATPEMYLKYGNNARKALALELKRKWMNKYIPNFEVHVLYGDSRTSKTRSVFALEGEENCYIPVYSESAGKFWFDGYDGENVLLINEFYGQARTSIMQQILDHYHMRLEVKGHTIVSRWTKVYITSNVSPEEWYSGWSSVPEKVMQSFINRFTSVTELKAPPETKKKTWADLRSKALKVPVFAKTAAEFKKEKKGKVVRSPVLPSPLPLPLPTFLGMAGREARPSIPRVAFFNNLNATRTIS